MDRDFSLSPLSTLPVGPPELVDLAAEAGFRSIGIRLCSPMAGGPDWPLRVGSAELRQTLGRLSACGISVFDVEVLRLGAETDVEAYVAAFDTAAALGAQRACVNVDDPDRLRTIDRFGRLCDLAAPYGLALDLEFMIWRPVARLAEAVAIVAAAGRRNGRVLVDALHLARSGGTPAAVAAVDPSLIGCVQLCDAPLAPPEPARIIEEARTGRLAPGEGELPLDALLDALPESTPIAVEVPLARSLPSATPLERARHIRAATEKFLRARLMRRNPASSFSERA